MIDVKYLTPREAMYDRHYPFCIEPTEWNSFLNFKDDQALRKREPFRLPDLVSFNGHPIHYAASRELMLLTDETLRLAIDDLHENSLWSRLETSMALSNLVFIRKLKALCL